jgi:hypothetical protein
MDAQADKNFSSDEDRDLESRVCRARSHFFDHSLTLPSLATMAAEIGFDIVALISPSIPIGFWDTSLAGAKRQPSARFNLRVSI